MKLFRRVYKQFCSATPLINLHQLNVKSSISHIQHLGTMMNPPVSILRELQGKEFFQDRIVNQFIPNSEGIQNLKVYEFKETNIKDKTVNYPRNCFYSVVFPLSTCELVKNYYAFHDNDMRFGRILEMIDYIATRVAYKYSYQDKDMNEATIMMVCGDNVKVFKKANNELDITIQGYPTFVGKSSVEVQVEVLQIDPETKKNDLIACGTFLLAARHHVDFSKPYIMPKLSFEGEVEQDKCKIRYEIGKKNQQNRKQAASFSLKKTTPSQEEGEILHNFFLMKEAQDSNNQLQIKDTLRHKDLLMHYQDRNLHGKIFGGVLMREAFELGWLAAYIHAKGQSPEIFHIDDFQFINSVDVGSILTIDAKIGYVKGNLIHVCVECNKISKDFQTFKTNDFHFTFIIPDMKKQIQYVYPKTYSEAMVYIDSRRRVKQYIDY